MVTSLLAVTFFLCALLFTACSSTNDSATLGRYLEADARPSDPSIRTQYGRAKLPSDFPTGLPVPKGSEMLGWVRTTSDTAYSWQVIYEVAGDAGSIASGLTEDLPHNG